MAPANPHTAGISADKSFDGPEIGTLVVVIDRAKNLPNRKSMGKQDPYCAARLGKEAKKTETDKRGGQTPRWDQELRFEVRNAPDYYRLKVSVFNDDKRTELIGETWLPLEDIITQGGGRSDQWHQLNCKGRYAGDIRIELTYYDSQPRESRTEAQQHLGQVNGSHISPKEGLSGPRQPKSVKRRPLPANPGGTPSPEANHRAVASPIQGTPRAQQLDSTHHPASYGPPDEESYSHEHGWPPSDVSYGYGPSEPQDQDYAPRFDQVESPNLHYANMDRNSAIPYRGSLPSLSDGKTFSRSPQYFHGEPMNENQRPFHQDGGYAEPIRASGMDRPMQSLPRPQPLRPQQALATSHSQGSMPEMMSEYRASAHPHGELRAMRSDDVLNHQHGRHWSETDIRNPTANDGPPLPPVHRNHMPAAGPQTDFPESRAYAQPAAAPYENARPGRAAASGSPLAQVHNMREVHSGSNSPLTQHISRDELSQGVSYGSAHATSSHTIHPSARARGQSTPSALIAGFHNEQKVEDMRRRSLETSAQTYLDSRYKRPTPQQSPLQATHSASSYIAEAEHPPRVHRNSVPAARSNQNSSDPRVRRKAVSPQPDDIPSERRHSDLPFSPDSFDAFNPNMASAQSVNQHGARYTSPDQAREAAIQSEKAAKRGDEPIIGDDGRVIDPSDHLPADTWAPEPTPKGIKKGPEVTLRFKHSPAQSSPSPRVGRTPLSEGRPNIMATPPHHAQSAENSPTFAARARLQKKPRAAMTHPQPYSSPAVPTLESDYAPQRPNNHLPRHYPSDYPLRERENPAHVNGSCGPGYGGPRYGGGGGVVPPPVPDKVPIMQRGQEEWGDGSVLSEEMRNIDIGARPTNGARTRPRRYGF